MDSASLPARFKSNALGACVFHKNESHWGRIFAIYISALGYIVDLDFPYS